MTNQNYLSNMKEIQRNLLGFLEAEDNKEEHYQKIIQKFDDLQIQQDQIMLKSIFHLLSNISTNHCRKHNFYEKIEQILLYLKKSMLSYLSNFDIFKLFQKDKSIILFLIKENILTVDQLIADKMCSRKLLSQKYPQFFALEIKPFINRNNLIKVLFTSIVDEDSERIFTPEICDCDIDKNDIKYIDELIQEISNKNPEKFEKKREIGENDQYICDIIRNDSIEEFISYIKKESISLNSIIDSSIYETNQLLIQNKVTLIEYAAFFGSIHIFNYLYKNNVDLTSSLWIYGIHSANAQIIQILEEKNILPDDETYGLCLKESIKCHHNDIANYLIKKIISKNDDDIVSHCLHYYNFEFLSKNLNNKLTFYCACKYDHYQIVDYFIKNKEININASIISK